MIRNSEQVHELGLVYTKYKTAKICFSFLLIDLKSFRAPGKEC